MRSVLPRNTDVLSRPYPYTTLLCAMQLNALLAVTASMLVFSTYAALLAEAGPALTDLESTTSSLAISFLVTM